MARRMRAERHLEGPHAPLEPRRLRANVTFLRAMNFTWMFLLVMPVIVPFFGELGLTPGQVFEVQALFGLGVVLLEVPTGYVSDLMGRKACLVLAGLLHGAAMTLLTVVHGFWGVAAYQVLAALAVCLFSGTDVALLYDSLEALDALGDAPGSSGAARSPAHRRGLGQRLFWMQAGETSAALVGGWIALISLREVALWNAVVAWLPFLAALCLTEVPQQRLARRRHLENVAFVWRELFVVSPAVRLVLLGLIAYGLATLLAVWVFQGFWEHLRIDLALFGYLWAGYNLTVALVGRLAHRVEERLGVRATVLAIAALPVAGFLGMAWVAPVPGLRAAVVGVALGLAFQFGRGLTQVVLKDELNGRVAPEMRATANSVSSLGVRLGYAAFGPLLGRLIDGPGYATALSAAGAGYALVALFLALPLAGLLAREHAARRAG